MCVCGWRLAIKHMGVAPFLTIYSHLIDLDLNLDICSFKVASKPY